jgi:heat shock protein HslJ
MPKISPRVRLAAACVASGLITAACASYGANIGAPVSDLTGTRWVANAINGDLVTGAAAPQLSFGVEDRLSGSGGCNNIFGVYEADAGQIVVRALGQTERACAQPVMVQEQAFLAVLQSAARYEREAGRLVIVSEDGGSVTLTARA